MRRIYYALLVVGAAALSVWIAIHYDVVALARAFLAPAWRWLLATGRVVAVPAWQGARVAAQPLVQNYLLRRAESPIWNILLQGAMALVGYRTLRRIYDQGRRGGAVVSSGVDWWRSRHRLLRWAVGSAILFIAGFLGFGLLILPFWMPLSARLLQSLHFWWVDRFINRWIGPAQRRFRRVVRTNPLLRTFRRPHRIALYWLVVAVRRSARALRGTVGHAIGGRRRSAPEAGLLTGFGDLADRHHEQ